jgi:hypothetical protein
LEALPFAGDDVTAGAENELQAVVQGKESDVDLPLTIRNSNYFRNIVRRAASGDASETAVSDLEKFLADNEERVWENSWVRIRLSALSDVSRRIFYEDLREDKSRTKGPFRKDADKFFAFDGRGELIRVPVSYLLKLTLAEVTGVQDGLPPLVERTALRLMGHFLNDNTSPETHSFHVVPLRPSTGFGRAVARETAKRFLLTQLLVMYANETLLGEDSGQRASVYFSPHPPVRQKALNEIISDAFYRELFMSPCLSGWENGRKKHEYMRLCHEALSRSRLNAIGKLRDAGIITRNLTTLPTVSNISLANNGTHVSLGSRKLTRYLKDPSAGVTAAVHEKFIGDLVIKIFEHFLPLFVGTYSAAPYRLGFSDFHPEKALGFLPHELDFTHLRMIWRRWKKKASLSVCGRPLTPFGPPSLDGAVSLIFRVRGDFVPDYRLLDYPVAFMSTPRSPAFDGVLGTEARLKKDLADLGILDPSMALYVPYRLRQCRVMGFSGFEGRHYSLFESFAQDMGEATSLQTLITALAFKYALSGAVTHAHIPDEPFFESERRQVFFCAAAGIPTFYVLSDTRNMFMRRLIERTAGVRHSRRYPRYKRVYVSRFQAALLDILNEDGAELIDHFGVRDTLADARARFESPDVRSTAGRLTAAILDDLCATDPLRIPATRFNRAAESYYRTTLKRAHVREAFDFFEEDFACPVGDLSPGCPYAQALRFVLGDASPLHFVRSVRRAVLEETATSQELTKLIDLMLILEARDAAISGTHIEGTRFDENGKASVRGESHGTSGFGNALQG